MSATGVVNTKSLRNRCQLVEAELVSTGRRKRDEFEALRPHGRQGRGAGPWLLYLLNLTREAGAARSHERLVNDPATEREIINALRNQPELVELVTPLRLADDDEPVTILPVYAKSLTALIEMHYWDAELERLGPYVVWLRQSTEARDLELLHATLDRIAYVQQMLVWILTTGRDGVPAMCPYPKDVLAPIPPALLAGLDVIDYGRILMAHLRVNHRRLSDLAELTRVAATSSTAIAATRRPSWSLFVNQQGEDLNISAEEVMDRWSMMSVVARAALKVKAHYEQKQASERERKMRGAGA